MYEEQDLNGSRSQESWPGLGRLAGLLPGSASRQGRLSAFTCVSGAEMELVWRLNETVYMIVLRKV